MSLYEKVIPVSAEAWSVSVEVVRCSVNGPLEETWDMSEQVFLSSCHDLGLRVCEKRHRELAKWRSGPLRAGILGQSRSQSDQDSSGHKNFQERSN